MVSQKGSATYTNFGINILLIGSSILDEMGCKYFIMGLANSHLSHKFFEQMINHIYSICILFYHSQSKKTTANIPCADVLKIPFAFKFPPY